MPGPTFIESYERTWWAASFWDPLRTGVLALRLHALPRVSRPEAALMSLSPGDHRGFFLFGAMLAWYRRRRAAV